MNVNNNFTGMLPFSGYPKPISGREIGRRNIVKKEKTPEDKPPEKQKPKRQKITIIHTNDLHAQLDPYKNSEKGGKLEGGMEVLAHAVKREVNKNPDNTLLLDAGDISTGSPISNFFEGKPMVDTMNVLKYDAMTLGNHDIGEGYGTLKTIVSTAGFPVLSANFVDLGKSKELQEIKPYVIKQVGDIKVGIVGLTTVDTLSMLSREDRKLVSLTATKEAAKKNIAKMKKEGANLIVVLSHLGIEADRKLARDVEGINVIVGGHSHTELEKPEKVGKTYIVQTGSKGKNIGRLDLYVDVGDKKATIKSARGKLVNVLEEGAQINLFAYIVINKYRKKLEPIMSRKIGKAITNLDQEDYHTNIGESPLANCIMDIMRDDTGAEMAIMSASTLRADIPRGDITVENIYQMLPWKTKISTMKMKGKDVRDAIEQIMSSFLHNFAVGGLKVEVDSSRPKGQRVVNVFGQDGKPLDPDKTYKVATIDWLANGSANVDAFTRGKNRKDSPKDLRDVIIEKIENESEISAGNDGRIVDLAR